MHSDLLTIDGGNTHLKLGWFQQGKLVQFKRLTSDSPLDEYLQPNQQVVLSNVGDPSLTERITSFGAQVFILNNSIRLPFKNMYKTPETLGIDRICNIAAVHDMYPQHHVLVLDLGTCIKMDFIHAEGIYEGGTISPGLALRYKSLHDYTATLPILSTTGNWGTIGTSTSESIQFGVMNSVRAELEFYISEFRFRFPNVKVVFTGGDAHYFDMGQKNSIFVDENLTLKGIYALYLSQFP
jgi:type III pantothenate kinase